MVTLLVGHRGSGKSSYLNSLRGRGPVLDLDAEIQRRTGRPVAEILSEGEAGFREIERRILNEAVTDARENLVIAVGAGFEGPPPEGTRVLWIRRETDGNGRSFLNRPRLNADLSPLEEYLARFPVREERYREWSHEHLLLPEGYEGGLEGFLFDNAWSVPYDLTLLPENFRDWPAFLARRMKWGVRRFELRDDLLSAEQIERARADIPAERLLFSRRRKGAATPAGLAVDWALELGGPEEKPFCASVHEIDEGFDETLLRLERSRAEVLKLAVEVRNFTELEHGHKWWLQDPARRAFLPRSVDGRWRWYRSLFGPRMPLHFFREGEGSALDQPPLWQVLLQPKFENHFGAVLGHPVSHSRSPLEHGGGEIPFVAVDVEEDELPFALKFLRSIGLSRAAVTSPLKRAAWALSDRLTPEARRTQSVNTIYIDEISMRAHNTDVLALADLKSELPGASCVWLWGGGGVKSSVRSVWPDAVAISAREGQAPDTPPDLLIWATGRSRPFQWPPSHSRPKLILDLNYGDDSPGLEWAVRENLGYQSGLKMFKRQAEYQRRFWRACEAGESV